MEFGVGLLGLELQIDLVQRCQGLADIDGLADFDQAFGDLAGDPKAHVGLDPGLDRADKTALRRFRLVMGGGDQHRARRHRFFGDFVVAAGQGERQKSQRCAC